MGCRNDDDVLSITSSVLTRSILLFTSELRALANITTQTVHPSAAVALI